MDTPNLWSVLVVVACLATVLRLLTFRRGPSRHRSGYAWLAWLLIVADTYLAVRCATGIRPPPGPFAALACFALAAVVAWHRGDLAHAHRSLNAVLLGVRGLP